MYIKEESQLAAGRGCAGPGAWWSAQQVDVHSLDARGHRGTPAARTYDVSVYRLMIMMMMQSVRMVHRFYCAARQPAHGKRWAVVKAVLVVALLAVLTPRGSGQLIVGGMFNTVAGNNDPYFKKIAQWRGMLERGMW